MAKYQARTCPRCRYFMGISIPKPLPGSKQSDVISFCLNCSYRLPMHMVLHGISQAASRWRRGRFRVARSSKPEQRSATTHLQSGGNSSGGGEITISSGDYSRHLRVIGQELERSGIGNFNLECTGNAYVLWTRNPGFSPAARSILGFGAAGLKRWRKGGQFAPPGDISGFVHRERRLEYSQKSLARLEQRAKLRRQPMGGSVDGHSRSQLLRTVGSLVAQRNHRLLGISWADLSVCIVVETVHHKREIDVFRPDNLYDIWVRMYLKRQNRALSDVPH